MKKLNRVKLQNAVVLENSEMKTIYGGSGGGNQGYCSGGGIDNITCSGECLPTSIWDPENNIFILQGRECKAFTMGNGSGSTITSCDCG